MKYKIYIFIISSILLLSCSDSEDLYPENPEYTKLQIDSITPSEYSIGDTITIYGNNFGNPNNNYTILFEGTPGTDEMLIPAEEIINWEDNQITLLVPNCDLKGIIYISEQASNKIKYEVSESLIIFLIRLFVQLSLAITVIFIYLQINKIWKRKHEKEVADAQSLTGLFIYILNCILWIFYYILIEDDPLSTLDTSIYVFQGTILFIIGTGIFVKGQRKEKIWDLIKRSLRIERKEADYLLKKWFKPQNAEAIIHILHQIAMIDNEYDPKEAEIIETFAKEWNIDYDIEKLEKERKQSKDNNYMRLRKSLEDYLFREPPDEQVAQLKDMITTMIEADEKVTEEEELISSELIPMIENYLKEDNKAREFKVLLVPQSPDQESIISSLFPNAKKTETSGGTAFEMGTYYSHKYAEMMCEQYRNLKFFTIVNTPPGTEIKLR